MTKVAKSTRLPTTRVPGTGSQAQRLASLHRMSGTLVHDLNNLLGVILSANERLAEELPEGSDPQQLARLGLEAAERGADLLRRTLWLAHDSAPRAEPVDCADALRTLRRLARQAIAPSTRLRISAPAKPLRCAGDQTGLEMALFNLCLNAGQAIGDGGEVVVEARLAGLGPAEARRLGLAGGDYVAFTVRDTGKGMSAETLARATDPLFTTKAGGTGLGLSSVIDFAASACGAFALRSVAGQGTAAILYLPLASAAQGASAA